MMKKRARNVTVEGPNRIDQHVGSRVRMLRKYLGISQGALAGEIDLTFQQVQKYERGTNRISASKLYEIGKVLRKPAGYFFEGFDDPDTATSQGMSESERSVQSFLYTSEGIALAEAFPRIQNPRHRRKLLELVRALSDE